MNQDYTHITMLLDRSGSMKSVCSDTIGGFNSFLDSQKEVKGKATFSLVQFDDRYEANYTGVNIQDIPHLNEKTYIPRGWTRLLDAIGKSIVETGQFLSKMPEAERPAKVVFVISTDGEENDSKEFTSEAISKMIETQTNVFKWEFVFLGANQDAILTAEKLKIKKGNAMTYAANTKGIIDSAQSLAENLTSYRGGQKMSMVFSKKDRQKQKDAGVNI